MNQRNYCFGRSDYCEIYCEGDLSISRSQGYLKFENDEFWVYDGDPLNPDAMSTNGTFKLIPKYEDFPIYSEAVLKLG